MRPLLTALLLAACSGCATAPEAARQERIRAAVQRYYDRTGQLPAAVEVNAHGHGHGYAYAIPAPSL
jgi:hypothetical protein